MARKILIAISCVLLIVSASVMGTIAYLIDTDEVLNTFSVGKVDITLDEADVDEDGELIVDDDGNPVDRVKGNEYHLIPGQTYIKDPTVTVEPKSEPSYVRMIVTFNCLEELDAIFAPTGADLKTIFNGYDPEMWKYVDEVRDETANTIAYEFRYKETVEGGDEGLKLDALFDSFTLPAFITGEQLETIKTMTITINAHAIQAANFADDAQTGKTAEDIAWESFDAQTETQSTSASTSPSTAPSTSPSTVPSTSPSAAPNN